MITNQDQSTKPYDKNLQAGTGRQAPAGTGYAKSERDTSEEGSNLEKTEMARIRTNALPLW